jgi:DNA-binding CsgD family transcriptional regulator
MPSSLVGRSEELGMLEAILDRAQRGTGGVALVQGEAGIGKTRLADALGAAAHERGFRVFWGTGHELEQDRPFGAVAEAMALSVHSYDPARRRIGELLLGPEPGSRRQGPGLAGAPELRFRLLTAILDLLEEEASKAPTLLVLENLHWADPSTLLTLDHLLATAAETPTVLLGTLRPVPQGSELRGLIERAHQEGAQLLVLDPLSDAAVDELTMRTVRAAPGPALLKQVARASGNPFFILELLAALSEDDVIQVEDGVADVEEKGVPAPLRLTILRRLNFLSEPSLQLLRIAAVLGSSFTLPDLSVVAGQPIDKLFGLLQDAFRSGVLVDQGGRIAFRHDLVREAVYEDLPESVRIGLHLQAGRSLAAARSPPEQVATHLSLGAQVGDAEAVAWLRRAAEQAFPRAPRIAVNLLGRAAELLPEGAPERDSILADRVHGLLWAGRLQEAESLARDVLSRPHDRAVAGAMRNSLARVLVWQGRPADSLTQIEAGLREPGIDPPDRAYLLAELALRLLHCRNLDACTYAANEAIRLSRRANHHLAECEALCALCWSSQFRGNLQTAMRLADQATSIGKSPGDLARLVVPAAYAAWTFIQADRFAEARDAIRLSLQEHDETGPMASPTHAFSALRSFHTGEWDRASIEAETCLSVADVIGVRALVVLARSVLAHLGIHRSDLNQAEQELSAADREIVPNNPSRFGLPWQLWGKALLAESRGDVDTAFTVLMGTWDLLTTLDCLGECQEFSADLVRLALVSDRPDRAGAVCDAAHELARRARTASARGMALRCRGLLEKDPDLLIQAVHAYAESPRVLEVALAHEDAGRALLVSRRDEAVPHLQRAAESFEWIGAVADLARAEALLRQAGVRRGVRGRRDRPTTGWESLTGAELEVARLAAEGLTNREIGVRLFVSRRTVGTHLSHIFTKLGLSSRVELATEVTRRAQGRPHGDREVAGTRESVT